MLALLTADACGAMCRVDFTPIKGHQNGSNAAGGAGAQVIGEISGGPNTKLAVPIDGLGRAVGFNRVPGNWHDPRAVEVSRKLNVRRSSKRCWKKLQPHRERQGVAIGRRALTFNLQRLRSEGVAVDPA